MPPHGWMQLTLGEITENFDAIRVPVREADRSRGPYPYYGASGVVDYVDGYLFDGEYLLIAEDGENLRTRQTPIVFIAKGKFWVNNHAHIVRGNEKATTRFLAYALARADIRGYLTGSTMPKLTQGNMNRIPLLIPPLAEQRAIESVLGALDDKIELNRRMNETLEAIARAIFKSWFVDFDPVRAKAAGRKPIGISADVAALFPSRFIESALGRTPAGWQVCTIKDVTSTIEYGFTQSASEASVGPKFLRITDIQGGRVDWSSVPFCRASGEEYEKYHLRAGDVLVARTGASTGENVYLAAVPDAVFASYLVRFQFASRSLARYVGEFMRTEAYSDYIAGCIGGSAQPNASAQTLAGAPLVIPPVELAQCFFEAVRPMDLRKATNSDECATLSGLRDTLLPKLLSGEVRITTSQKAIAEALD